MRCNGVSADSAGRKWLEADQRVHPTRMLKFRSFMAASGTARRMPQHVARSVRTPPDDERGERHWRVVAAMRTAVNPNPWRTMV